MNIQVPHRIGILLFYIVYVCAASSCLKDDELNLSSIINTPRNLGDGLTLSKPSEEAINAVVLDNIYESVYADANLWSLRSLLVFRNGNLVAEAYLKNENDLTDQHIIWSCTKQVMGVLAGVAQDQGLIADINDPISLYFDTEFDQHADKAAISIEDLLSMRSGIDYNNEEQTDALLQQIPENSIELILEQSMIDLPGEVFHYNDGNPHLISAMIQEQSGITTAAYADEFLFSKIELNNYNWVSYKDGVTLGGFGIETTPRELAKVALCVADSGRWKGQQVVSSEWINQMTNTQAEIDNFDFTFGYLWWIDESRGLHFMWGVGGQFAFIIPDKNLVVVMTSFPNTKGEYEIQADEALEIVDQLVEACN